MKLSSLANLLSQRLSASEYSAEIAGDIAEYTRRLAKPGSHVPIRVTEDIDLLLDRGGLGLLCRLFACGQLTADELAYTADVLELAERVEFAGPDVASDLSECTDPEINGSLSAARALEIAGTGTAV